MNRACASCRRTVQRAACVPAPALSTATRFVEYRLTDGHSVGAAPGNHWGSIEKTAVRVLLLFLLVVLRLAVTIVSLIVIIPSCR